MNYPIDYLTMCTLDDKLLGEKVHNYCSSSEGEDNDDEDGQGEGGEGGGGGDESSAMAAAPPIAPPQNRKYNTGPKGVLADYKHFKELEAQQRKEKTERDKKIAKR